MMPPHLSVDTVHYKIFMCGKSGVGKTALAARLAGINIPSMHYETKGTPLPYTHPGYVTLMTRQSDFQALRRRWCTGR